MESKGCKPEYRPRMPLSNDFSEMQNNYEDSIPHEWKEKRKQRENDLLYWKEELRRKEAELEIRATKLQKAEIIPILICQIQWMKFLDSEKKKLKK